jgi:hypothetical protein
MFAIGMKVDFYVLYLVHVYLRLSKNYLDYLHKYIYVDI